MNELPHSVDALLLRFEVALLSRVPLLEEEEELEVDEEDELEELERESDDELESEELLKHITNMNSLMSLISKRRFYYLPLVLEIEPRRLLSRFRMLFLDLSLSFDFTDDGESVLRLALRN